MSDPKPEKPYKLESISRPWSETDVETWWLTIMDFLKSASRYKKSMQDNKEWKQKRITNRGLTGGDAADRADVIDSILLKIAKNGPSAIFQDIVHRSTSYKYVQNAIRKVCGFPSSGNKLVNYFSVKSSFDNSKDEFNSHYWNLRDIRIGCLLKKDSEIKFEGKRVGEDEELTPALECQIVADWLESIGGVKLIKFVFQEYSKELESCTLYDLKETLGQKETMTTNMDRLDLEETGKLNRFQERKQEGFRRGNSGGKPARQKRHCFICEEAGKRFDSHDTKFCWNRDENKKSGKASSYKQEAKVRAAKLDKSESSSSGTEEDLKTLFKKLKIKAKNRKTRDSSEDSD